MKSPTTTRLQTDVKSAQRCLRTPIYHAMRCTAALLVALGAASSHAQSCFNPLVAPSTPTSDFDTFSDGTTIHVPSGLHWMRCSLGQGWSGSSCSGNAQNLTQWRDALQLVNAVNGGDSNADGDGAPGFAGHNDWRLPNFKELSSLHEACRQFPAVNELVFPNSPSQGVHWTSTTVHTQALAAWYFDFGQGRTGFALKSDTLPRFARLVRAGAGAGGYAADGDSLFVDGFDSNR